MRGDRLLLGLVPLLACGVWCSTRDLTNDVQEAGPHLLYRDGPTWQGLSSLKFAYDFDGSAISALVWTPATRGLGSLADQPLLVAGDSNGSTWAMGADGALLAHAQQSSQRESVVGLTAWYQPGNLAILAAHDAGRFSAYLVSTDALAYAAATGVPASLDLVADAPGMCAFSSKASMRVLTTWVPRRKGHSAINVLPSGPVRVAYSIDCISPEACNNNGGPQTGVLRVSLRSSGLSNLELEKDTLACQAVASTCPGEVVPENYTQHVVPGLAFLPEGVLTAAGTIVAYDGSREWHCPVGIEETHADGEQLPFTAAATFPNARGGSMVYALTHQGQRLQSMLLGSAKRSCSVTSSIPLRAHLGPGRFMTTVGRNLLVIHRAQGISLYDVSGVAANCQKAACLARWKLDLSFDELYLGIAEKTGQETLPSSLRLAGSEHGDLAIAFSSSSSSSAVRSKKSSGSQRTLLASFAIPSAGDALLASHQSIPAWVHPVLQVLQGIGLIIVVAVVIARKRAKRGMEREQQQQRSTRVTEGPLNVSSKDRFKSFEAMFAGQSSALSRRRGFGAKTTDQDGDGSSVAAGAGIVPPGRNRLLRPPARTNARRSDNSDGPLRARRAAGLRDDEDGHDVEPLGNSGGGAGGQNNLLPASSSSEEEELLPDRLRALIIR